MVSDKDENLESFQIGLRSGVAAGSRKHLSGEQFEISKDDFPNLSAQARSKATFKKKASERVKSFKDVASSQAGSADERERAEKAKKAWENAMEVINQLSVKE